MGTHRTYHLLCLGYAIGGLPAPAWAQPQDGAAHSSISRIERSVETIAAGAPHEAPETTSPDLIRFDRDLLRQLGCLDPNGEIRCSFAH